MTNKKAVNIDEETIQKVGLRQSDKTINAQAPDARVFEIPGLENVFIMEKDLYGNEMPKGSCFLAFYGRNGLMGQQLRVSTLKKSSIDDLKKIVDSNSAG
jgi:hypothetical protein